MTSSKAVRLDRRMAFGAYGLTLSGISGAERMLVAADAGWPRFHLDVRVGQLSDGPEHVDDGRARVRLRTGGWIEIDRRVGRALFTVPELLSAEELVHPFLAPVAAVAAYWYGRESVHGGGFAVGGTAWGVVGDRMGGKSTLLAALANRDIGVVSDDVLVLSGREVFAGPRTIDLRADAADRLGAGKHIGVAGARERWRLELPPVEPRLPLGGWIFTTWSDEDEIRRMPPAETLVRLLRNRATNLAPKDPAAFLQLSALPAWELRRSRSWDAMPGSVDQLLAALAGE